MTRFFIFLMVKIRPNIIFAILVASYFIGHQYTKAIKTILQYLKDLNK